ncbi:MAG: LuxR C-terminal-related transcriptional regulator [Ginsengibacter sp.]
MLEDSRIQSSNLDLSAYKKFISIFSVGDFYYFLFNFHIVNFEFLSPDVEKVLGYKLPEFDLAFLIEHIHPEDVSWVLDFEATGIDFFKALPAGKIMKYKARYDYRIRKANGEYVRILQQVIVIEQSETGEILRTLGMHTDITDLKKEGKPILSFIGLEGEPSYINVKPKTIFSPSIELFTSREKEILRYLIDGKSSPQIAKMLYLSLHTVNTHRNNMMHKANCTKVTELINQSITLGYI